MKTLVVDIGGTSVKVWKTDERSEEFSSGKKLTPRRLVDEVKAIADDWPFRRVSVGYPGAVRNGHPSAEPYNLGRGWVEFAWSNAFGRPVRIMNDACMQALGGYEGGRMLYLGLGTAMGTAFIFDGTVVPLALGHLPFRNGKDFGFFLSRKGLKLHGGGVWRDAVLEAGAALKAAFMADYVVFGGGNAKELDDLPEGFRRGGNHNAYFGGLRMWDDAARSGSSERARVKADVARPRPDRSRSGAR
ncbi:MAG TPA: hypothetical protein VKU82_00955 [Planctomycetaceae bacterium]|nr:hypothetical protein [Planctomycetaceae bacterium]